MVKKDISRQASPESDDKNYFEINQNQFKSKLNSKLYNEKSIQDNLKTKKNDSEINNNYNFNESKAKSDELINNFIIEN